jgi:hypothetical protein
MKTVWMKKIFIGLAGLAALGSPRAYAQSEIDPDHFEMTNTEPFQQSKTRTDSQVAKLHYEGNFTLPYRLQCKGKNLPPGKYSVSLNSDGRTAQVTLYRKGQAVRIEGIKQKKTRNRRRDALIVERRGTTHQLSLIHVAQIDLLFSPTPAVEHPAHGKPRSIERLPLILTDPQK